MPFAPLALLYCNDEDICIRCGPGDFKVITPSSQLFAKGTDGAFAPGTPWLLTSASTNWVTQGVLPGMVVDLQFPGTGVNASSKVPDAFLAVDSVSSAGIVLHRLGQAAGAGMPPGPAAGAAGVTFTIVSLLTQINNASCELNSRFGVDPLIIGRRPVDLYDVSELDQVCVLTVLKWAYMAAARLAKEGQDDLFAKSAVYAQDLDDVLARCVVRWASLSGFGTIIEPTTTKFSTRLTR
jgi:hypothetical protein